jgi:hypothetical protein
LPFSCLGGIFTFVLGACCFCFIKKNKKAVAAEMGVDLPAIFDSSSEVSSDSVSTDEETRAIEAKHA